MSERDPINNPEDRRSQQPTPESRAELLDSVADLTQDSLDGGLSKDEAFSALDEVIEELLSEVDR